MAHIPRIYIRGRLASGPLRLDPETSKRLTGVMRVRDGDEFRVFCGDGREWRAILRGAAKGSAQAEVAEVVRQEPLRDLVLEVWCSMVRPNRFDWAIEKCVEAGADIIRPLITGFAARRDAQSLARDDRSQRLIIEATEQSGRLHLPVVEKPERFAALLGHHHGALVVVDATGRPPTAIRALLPERGRLAVAIGPEGGFSAEELTAARATGALCVSLGPHILRTETAAVVATALFRAR